MSTLVGGLVAMIVGFGGPAGFLNLPVPPDVTDSAGAGRAMHGANYVARVRS